MKTSSILLSVFSVSIGGGVVASDNHHHAGGVRGGDGAVVQQPSSSVGGVRGGGGAATIQQQEQPRSSRDLETTQTCSPIFAAGRDVLLLDEDGNKIFGKDDSCESLLAVFLEVDFDPEAQENVGLLLAYGACCEERKYFNAKYDFQPKCCLCSGGEASFFADHFEDETGTFTCPNDLTKPETLSVPNNGGNIPGSN